MRFFLQIFQLISQDNILIAFIPVEEEDPRKPFFLQNIFDMADDRSNPNSRSKSKDGTFFIGLVRQEKPTSRLADGDLISLFIIVEKKLSGTVFSIYFDSKT